MIETDQDVAIFCSIEGLSLLIRTYFVGSGESQGTLDRPRQTIPSFLLLLNLHVRVGIRLLSFHQGEQCGTNRGNLVFYKAQVFCG